MTPHHGYTENKYIVDDLLLPLDFWQSLFSEEVLDESHSFEGTIDNRAKYNDNLLTAASNYVYSQRLIDILTTESVQFQKFPITLTVNNGNTSLLYYLCRLTDRYEFFDPVLSKSGVGVEELYLSQHAGSCSSNMFIDASFPHVCVVHHKIREAIKKGGITGCDFKQAAHMTI